MPRRRALLPRLRSAWRLRLVLVTLGALLCGALAWQVILAELRQGLEQELLVSHRALQAEIDRFRSLPRVAGEDARIRAALIAPTDPNAIDAANRYLEKIATQTGSGRLYLLNHAGVTLASSNWNEPDSYVGHDYSFRPYFTDASANGSGAVYAIGVTTGEPGYFISTRVDDPGLGARGVMVVKIDLRPLEQAWAETGQRIAVTDRDDVVFLSSQPDWRYRPLTPLPADALARLDASRLYARSNLDAAAPLLPKGSELGRGGEGRVTTLRGTPFENGWRLLAATPLWPARAGAVATSALVLLAGLLGLGLADMRRHRRRLIALRLRQTEVMERKVRQRTAELAREIDARRQVEADLRATQATLVQSEKMAALGRMSAAIVHEVSQPLAAMEATLTAAEFGLSRAPEQTAVRLQSARGLIRRMQRMTKHLKNFSRREAAPLSPVAVTEVARSALALAQPRADAAGVQLQFTPPDRPLMVRAGQARLEQVLVNLLHNAIEAVEPGHGEVALAVETQGDELILRVRDNGPGIPPEVLPRVTEPFFSTKIGGEGLGLGLAICFEVVQQFGGRLDIRSGPGGGAEIAVILPLLETDDSKEAAE
ncbi:ATP-binding protein [Salipiger sp. PrR002]|uniref:sensor histidine kinase n=1 Tax=Salipiger sp. PrR002 TaxID=2706489 RepID=UPI0013BB97E5|nr:ATP-binding protein [Salipiger sp. PrR002]NDW02252.1 sensor histidine kinase [Salipiger sp. PrR002]NDW59255.1 sensor histidine kinase [Salipiger sp. PrR004]